MPAGVRGHAYGGGRTTPLHRVQTPSKKQDSVGPVQRRRACMDVRRNPILSTPIATIQVALFKVGEELDRFDQKIFDLISGIDLCISNGKILPALMLIYSCIDILGWLDRPKDKMDSSRDEFINWVSTNMLPYSNLKCSALDLYAARCSLLHTFTPTSSRLYREGKAKKLVYIFGTEDEKALKDAILDEEDKQSTIVVSVESLYEALMAGIRNYKHRLIISIFKGEEKLSIVHNRQEDFFKI